jgi:ubiquitin carboxyl-terminal hydrolase 4/11/15
MTIYKAPKILIFSLKRFKSKNKYFKSKLETHVSFPINNVDFTNYVMNTSLPSDYQKETLELNGYNCKFLIYFYFKKKRRLFIIYMPSLTIMEV